MEIKFSIPNQQNYRVFNPWQLNFFSEMSLFLTYTETEITNGNWWKPLAIEKKKLVRKIFITGKKTVRNEHEMKDKYLLRKR